MKQVHFQEKYPITEVEVNKSETTLQSMAAVVAYFCEQIENNEKVAYIGTFDHYAHTRKIGGDIQEGILAAMNIVFCFGFALPNPHVMAVRPRSIGICEYADKFVVTFMDAPMKPANDAMQAWALGLRDIKG